MAVLTIRNLPDEVHRAIRALATRHGRSTEAEVRSILAEAAFPSERRQLGDVLAALGRELQLSDEDIDAMQAIRDRAPTTPIDFA